MGAGDVESVGMSVIVDLVRLRTDSSRCEHSDLRPGERALMPRETLPRKSARRTDSFGGEDRHTLATVFFGDRIFSYECNLLFLCTHSRPRR